MSHENQFQYRVIGVVEATKGEPLPMRLIHTATVFAVGGYTDLAAMLRAAGDALMFNGAPDACLGIVDFLQRCSALQDVDGGESDLACVASHLLAAISTKPLFDPQTYDQGERAHVAQVASDAGLPLGGAA